MRAAVLVLVAGCAFKTAPGDGASGDEPPGSPDQIVEDVASDFTGTVSSGVLDPLGLIEPDTYVTGGLHAVGFKKNGIQKTTDLSALPDLGPPSGEMYGMPLTGNWPANADPNKGQSQFPLALGIGQNDNYSVELDGEIYLPMGTTALTLDVDDSAVFEVSIGGQAQRLAADTGQDNQTLTLMANAAGWYPIRGAFSEDGGDARLNITTNGQPFPAKHLRAKTTATGGLQMGMFFASELQIGMLDSLDPGPGWDPGPIDHKPLVPLDYNLKATYSIRYQGQLRVDADGMYTISADVGKDADDHFRVFVDDQLVASHWISLADIAAAPIHLAPGWHALVVDYGDNTGNEEIHLDQDGTPIAADHLRPALVHGHVIAASPNNAACNFGMGTTKCQLSVFDSAPGQTVDYVDAEYILTGTRDYTLALAAGDTSDPLPVHAQANETEFPAQLYDYDAGHAASAGTSDLVTWTMNVTEPNVTVGSVQSFLMLTTHGGDGAPFSPVVAYESQPHDLPAGATLGAITVTGNLTGAIVLVEVRTADDAAALAAASYTPVGNGTQIPLAAGALIQFRVSASTDGWTFATIDKVAIDYTAP